MYQVQYCIEQLPRASALPGRALMVQADRREANSCYASLRRLQILRSRGLPRLHLQRRLNLPVPSEPA